MPAYFNDSQRQARQGRRPDCWSGSVAHHQRTDGGGPAYGLDKKSDETILVFDLGGGTFDVPCSRWVTASSR